MYEKKMEPGYDRRTILCDALVMVTLVLVIGVFVRVIA